LKKLRDSGIETTYFIYAGSHDPGHENVARDRGTQGPTNNPEKLRDIVLGAA